MKKIIFCVIFLLATSSCRWFGHDATDQFLRKFNLPDPPGSPLFKKGFRQGCAAILYARGNFFYRFMFKYEYDTKLSYNKDYRFGFKRGFNVCFLRIITTKTASPDKLLFPNGGGNDIGPGISSFGDYNDLTGGMFGGLSPEIGPMGDVGGVMSNWNGGVFNHNPIWAGNTQGQFFGQ